MIQLLKVLWNILLRKSDQSALPNSMFLLFVVFLFYFLSQSISGFTVSETPLVFVRSFFVDVVLMIVFLRILTQIFSTQDDFTRTLIALFGTGALFNIIASSRWYWIARRCQIVRSKSEWNHLVCWISELRFSKIRSSKLHQQKMTGQKQAVFLIR